MKMGTFVDQQEETIDNIESTAKDVEADASKACAFVFITLTWQGFLTLLHVSVTHLEKAVVHGRYKHESYWFALIGAYRTIISKKTLDMLFHMPLHNRCARDCVRRCLREALIRE